MVKGFINAYGQTYLTAFYTLNDPVGDPIEEEEIRAALEAKLPQYMIPQYFVWMAQMPVNANGKLDRKQLTAPDPKRKQNEYVAPQNEKQRLICTAFERVLKLDQVGIHDDLFLLKRAEARS